jgi:hypothetical protein
MARRSSPRYRDERALVSPELFPDDDIPAPGALLEAPGCAVPDRPLYPLDGFGVGALGDAVVR